MIGTLINAAAIIIGSLLGLAVKKILPDGIEKPIIKAQGIGLFMIGLNGMLTKMLSVEDGKVSSSGELRLLISLVVGTQVGTLLDIDGGIEKLGKVLENKFGKSNFTRGFIAFTMVSCIGAMSIMGPIAERLDGDMSILITKSIMDFFTAALLAVGLGWGVIGASVSVLVIQGGIALFAGLFTGIPAHILADFFIVGFSILVCIGFNFVADAKIKTANMIPALLVPIIYHLIVK